MGHLADLTSRLTLIVFALVNLSLVRLKAKAQPALAGAYVAPAWVPWAGFASCVALLLGDIAVMTGAFG